MSTRGSKTFRKRNLWQAEQFSRSIGEQHEYPRKSVIADRIAVAEFKRELDQQPQPVRGPFDEWQLEDEYDFVCDTEWYLLGD